MVNSGLLNIKDIAQKGGAENKRSTQIYYIMREELIKRKRKKDYCGWISILGLILGVMPLGMIFTLNDSDIYQLGKMLTNPLIWTGLVLLAFSYCYYLVYFKKAEEKYDNLKDELRMRIWNDFFFHAEKEEFLRETEAKYGINLYWK